MDIDEFLSHKVKSSSRNYSNDLSFDQIACLERDDDGVELHRLDIVFDHTKDINYVLYLMDISYFSGKLEAYFRYKRINFTRVEVTMNEMYKINYRNSGLQEVPIVHDLLNNRWLRDTTSIIEILEKESADMGYGDRSVMPVCPTQQFISRLLEDFADEYLWIPALYYRWQFRLDAGNLARRFSMHDFGREIPIPVPQQILQLTIIERQYQEYVKELGICDRKSKRYTEHVYRLMLKYLEDHFASNGQGFMLGNRPTLFDFGLYASMFRHFSLDPTPSKIMRLTAPSVYEWCARMWNANTLSTSETTQLYAEPGSIPYTWKPILTMLGSDYLPYLIANAQALDVGSSHFNSGLYSDVVAKPFHSWCAKRIIEHWDKLSPEHQLQVHEILADVDCKWPAFLESRELFTKTSKLWKAGEIIEPPLCPPPENIPQKNIIISTLLGTPHHKQKLKLPKFSQIGPFVKFLLLLQAGTLVSVIRFLFWLRSRQNGSLESVPELLKAFAYTLLGMYIAARVQSSLM